MLETSINYHIAVYQNSRKLKKNVENPTNYFIVINFEFLACNIDYR